MAKGQLARSELNVLGVLGASGQLSRAQLGVFAKGQLARAELSSDGSVAGQLARAELDSVQSAGGQLARAELRAGIAAAGMLARAELSSANVPVVGSPAAQTVEPGFLVTLHATGGNPTPSSVTWTQIGGTTVSLSGTGDTRTFTAPYVGGQLVFRYNVDGATCDLTVDVMPPTEHNKIAGVIQPIALQK